MKPCDCGCGTLIPEMSRGKERHFVKGHGNRLLHKPPQPVADRFWKRVIKSDGCWLWRGGHYLNGYGYLHLNAPAWKPVGAHRVSWEVNFGPIPDGLWVLHRCDNPGCVRPDHLFLGTRSDNVADMVAKGRKGFGIHAKLSREQVLSIRERVTNGEVQRTLAREFGVNPSTISNLMTRNTWSSLQP